MSFKPGYIGASSLVAGYGGIKRTNTSSMTISGSIALFDTANFTTTIQTDVTKTKYMWDLIANNSAYATYAPINTIIKNAGDLFLYIPVSNESVTIFNSFNSSTNSFTITCSIYNGTAGPINLTTQTLNFFGVYYELPF